MAPKIKEGGDADLGALVVKAADQLRMVGLRDATASVCFQTEGQWFRVTLKMIEEREVGK